jgi:hypothetical protein
MTPDERLNAALAADDPACAVLDLAQDLKAEGLTQVALYELFEAALEATDAGDPRHDALADTLDLIHGGPWVRGNALFEAELRDVAPSAQDLELVRQLVPHWYAWRRWAEELLCRVYSLERVEHIARTNRRGARHPIPGSNWTYRAHGVGVDVDRGINGGGIDFDFDKPDPDTWRLRLFAEKQLNAGNLPFDLYRPLLDDERRFEAASRQVLAGR